MAVPDYNSHSPPTLLAFGTLQGGPVNLDPSTILPPADEHGVYRATLRLPLSDTLRHGGDASLVAIKSVEDGRTREPRNVRGEVRLLQALQHDNIVPLLNAYFTPPSSSHPIGLFTLFTPFYPLSLAKLLDSPSFAPSTAPSPSHFTHTAHSLAHQLISAVAYLHSLDLPVAHRDLSPSNVMIGREGRVVLIDFGISLAEGEEKAGEMYFEVGTQPYRTPELIFASKAYDPLALDLWALGATLAELFTPLEAPPPPSPPSSPRSYEGEEGRWTEPTFGEEDQSRLKRRTLFEGSRTDFALTGSIFKLLGTPTLDTWPEASTLPAFSQVRLNTFPPQPLKSQLPNLPPASSSAPVASPSPLLDIISSFLRISASKRLSSAEALDAERWRDVEVLQPVDLGGGVARTGGEGVAGKTLGQLLGEVVVDL